MSPWQGKRSLIVITACMCRNGLPTFVRNEVEVTHDEYEEGVHYDLVEERLFAAGYEEPMVHFDLEDAPAFLVAGLSELASTDPPAPHLIVENPVEEP